MAQDSARVVGSSGRVPSAMPSSLTQAASSAYQGSSSYPGQPLTATSFPLRLSQRLREVRTSTWAKSP